MEDGRIWVMGMSKDLEYAREVAKRHEQKIYELVEVKDMERENESNN